MKSRATEELGGPLPKKANTGLKLTDVFAPLLSKTLPLISRDALLQYYNTQGKKNFYEEYKDPGETRLSLKALKEYEDAHSNNYKNLPTKAKQDYFVENPIPPQNPYISRDEVSKGLGRFTIDALSKLNDSPKSHGRPFQPIKIKDKVTTSDGRAAKGLYTPNDSTLSLSATAAGVEPLTLLTHEGNHAIEDFNPYIGNLVKDFLRKRVTRMPDNVLPTEYILNLYKGTQDIINLPDEFTNLYKLNNQKQLGAITQNDLNSPFNPWADKFVEIPAFALESMMRKNHPWQINKQTNSDSRKLLRKIMKKTHQDYRNMGLVDMNKPLGGNEPYTYNKNPVPKYGPPEDRSNYKDASDALVERIMSLQNPLKRNNPLPQMIGQNPAMPTSYGQQNQNPLAQILTQPYSSTSSHFNPTQSLSVSGYPAPPASYFGNPMQTQQYPNPAQGFGSMQQNYNPQGVQNPGTYYGQRSPGRTHEWATPGYWKSNSSSSSSSG